MKISLIAALTKNRVIGKDGAMPWHISDDLKYFKRITLNKPIIMGSNTFKSLNCKPLPKRQNIVITSNPDKFKDISGVDFVSNITDAINLCQDASEVMIIGGAKVYEQFLAKADRLYLSLVNKEYDGDTYFPDYSNMGWKVVSEEKFQDFTAVVLEK